MIKFKKIPVDQRFSYPQGYRQIDWKHKYTPEWAWSENLGVKDVSEDYPLGGMLEPYDIERDKKVEK